MSDSASHAPWVLVTDGAPDDGQSRTTLWTVRALSAAGYRAAATVSAPHSLAAASRACGRTLPAPALDGGPGREAAYAAAVRDELARRPYLTVLPTSDPALIALGYDVAHLVDKSSLLSVAERAGLPTPPTEEFPDLDSLRAAGHRLRYPVMVKPSVGHGAGRADGPHDLQHWSDVPGPLLVQPYITEGLRSVAGVVWNGAMVAAVHQRFLRTWPIDAGMACAAETVEPDLTDESSLLRLLDGYTGMFQADFAGPYLIDLNPRSFATISLAMESGANLVGIYCDLLMGRTCAPVRGRPGVFYRWLDADVRNVVARARTGAVSRAEAVRMLAPRRHTARGGPESLSDPGPLFARAAFLVDQMRRARRERRRTRAVASAT